ncbi:uncharacterized protein VTP21DRAFT_903 [Calcarisporiella thermophila]|uniref:uncharacterized protein n=1 Tax=Calcarisporiella thermophila TaxID=911321 RepID=UPI003743845E
MYSDSENAPCMRGITLIELHGRTFRIPTNTIPVPEVQSINIDNAGKLTDNETKSNTQIISVKMEVVQAMHRFIIGRGGEAINKIQKETGAKVNIQKEQDLIIIRGTRESTEAAKLRIEDIIERSRSKIPFTHFISLPLSDPALIRRISTLHGDILALNVRGLDSTILVPTGSLHITVGMLRLLSQKEIEGCVRLLKESAQEIYDAVGTRSVRVNVEGVRVMETDPSNAHVLYAKVEGEAMEKLCELLRDKFVKGGYMEEDKPLKPHVTLVNTKYRESFNKQAPGNHGKPGGRIAFDARPIISRFGDTDFGSYRVSSVQISKRFSHEKSGAYRSEGTVALP